MRALECREDHDASNLCDKVRRRRFDAANDPSKGSLEPNYATVALGGWCGARLVVNGKEDVAVIVAHDRVKVVGDEVRRI